VADDALTRVRVPIGLDHGAQSAPEIALSISPPAAAARDLRRSAPGEAGAGEAAACTRPASAADLEVASSVTRSATAMDGSLAAEA
jgi:hypothetical protein